jgi:hypothetical protein
VRHEETIGGRLRAAAGYPADTAEARAAIAARGREILEAAELQHRSLYQTEPPPRQWAHQAAEAAAAAEGFQVQFVSAYQIADEMNRQDPLNRVGIAPEGGSKGFALAVRSGDGTVRYQGDPAAIARLQETVASAQQRQAEAEHMSAQRLGPLGGTVA